MRFLAIGFLLLTVTAASAAFGLESKAFQLREDFGTDPLHECYLNYYYYIPCPQYSWFWWFQGVEPGQIVGTWFRIGDPSMTANAGCPPYAVCDPIGMRPITRFRVCDYAGYGTVYPGLFTVTFDIWCCDEAGCPVGPALWTSGPTEMCARGWNYINVSPPVEVAGCYSVPDPPSYPRVLLTATNTGSQATYGGWGTDNISAPLNLSCSMHDYGCCPALYPRPSVSHYSTMHSGDYGVNFANCPPHAIPDPGDPTGNQYGYLELAWRIYMPAHAPGIYDISGYVRDAAGKSVSGVAMTLAGGTGGSTTTDSAGYYAFWNLPGSVSYTVTPGKQYCTFNPASRTYPNLSQDYSNENYTATCTIYGISGYVRNAANRAVPGVAVVLTGGASDSTTTDSKGFYAFAGLIGGFSYTVTPGHEYCTFTPATRVYPNLSQNYINQNFTGDCTAGVPEAPPTTWGSIKALFK